MIFCFGQFLSPLIIFDWLFHIFRNFNYTYKGHLILMIITSIKTIDDKITLANKIPKNKTSLKSLILSHLKCTIREYFNNTQSMILFSEKQYHLHILISIKLCLYNIVTINIIIFMIFPWWLSFVIVFIYDIHGLRYFLALELYVSWSVYNCLLSIAWYKNIWEALIKENQTFNTDNLTRNHLIFRIW